MYTKKDFVQKMHEVAGYGNSRDLWSDWVMMLAISISQVNDPQEERENQFNGIKSKYTPKQLEGLAELTSIYFELVDDEPYQDLLGGLYMELNMGNSSTGQFFTPYNLAKLLSEMTDKNALTEAINQKGWCGINDSACGGGSLLLAGAENLLKNGINYQRYCLFIGQELCVVTACSAYIQMSMLGMPGAIICGDTLREPQTNSLPFINSSPRTWITPAYYMECWKELRLRYVTERMIANGKQG